MEEESRAVGRMREIPRSTPVQTLRLDLPSHARATTLNNALIFHFYIARFPLMPPPSLSLPTGLRASGKHASTLQPREREAASASTPPLVLRVRLTAPFIRTARRRACACPRRRSVSQAPPVSTTLPMHGTPHLQPDEPTACLSVRDSLGTLAIVPLVICEHSQLAHVPAILLLIHRI